MIWHYKKILNIFFIFSIEKKISCQFGSFQEYLIETEKYCYDEVFLKSTDGNSGKLSKKWQLKG